MKAGNLPRFWKMRPWHCRWLSERFWSESDISNDSRRSFTGLMNARRAHGKFRGHFFLRRQHGEGSGGETGERSSEELGIVRRASGRRDGSEVDRRAERENRADDRRVSRTRAKRRAEERAQSARRMAEDETQ